LGAEGIATALDAVPFWQTQCFWALADNVRPMKWKADTTTCFAVVACLVAGAGRIWFAHDYVLGSAIGVLGVAIAIRILFSLRSPDA
jgi:hypothetical protein